MNVPPLALGRGKSYLHKEVIGDCTLYLGDCLQVLPDIDYADHCITDPPYEIEAHTQQRRLLGKTTGKGKREIVTDKALTFAPVTEAIRNGLAEYCAEHINGWALAFCQAEAVQLWRESFEAAGAKYKRACVWIKPDGMPQYSGDRPGMGYESIVTAWCGPGKSEWNGGGKLGVFTYNKGESAGPNLHDTQKPMKLMCELVRLFTKPGQTVVDPFMGSASTGVACMKLQRPFIGIEIDPANYAIAVKRIKDVLKQGDFFIAHKRMEQLTITEV